MIRFLRYVRDAYRCNRGTLPPLARCVFALSDAASRWKATQ